MRTLSEFKKRLKPGIKMKTILYWDIEGKLIETKNFGEREISRVQTNAFALKTEKTDGNLVDSWCYFPKASEIEFKDQNRAIIKWQGGQLKYEFIS